MKTFTIKNALLIACSALMLGLISCDDDPGVENYYTAKGEMASTYLINHPERYSKFVEIINKSRSKKFKRIKN